MAEAQGKVFYHREGDAVTLRVQGKGVMAHGHPVRKLVEGLIAGGVSSVRADLRACTYMDSTFIGTLLSINKALLARGHGPLSVLMPSDACARILQQMGIDGMLPQKAGDAPAGEWHEIASGPADAPEARRNILEAHEVLAALPGPAGKQFEAVMRCLAQAEKAPPKSE